MDRVRVFRIVEYDGPRDWVENQIKNSIHGEKVVNKSTIRVTTLGTYLEIMKDKDTNDYF